MRGDLRVVQGGAAPVPLVVADPGRFQEDCAQAYAASWVARGFSQVRVDSATSRLERVLATFGMPAWEVTREDVDRVVGSWAAAGIAASTRRTYSQAFKGFHDSLTARKASEIEAVFGARRGGPPGHDPQRAGSPARPGGPRGRRPVQPAPAAPRVRHPQL